MNESQQHTKQIRKKALTIALIFAFFVQSLSPIAVFAGFQGRIPTQQQPTIDPDVPTSFAGTLIPGCPAGQDCAVFYRNDAFGNWNPSSVLSGGAEYHGSAGVRSTCETSRQICVEQGYEDVVCSTTAWEKNYWRSPSDNYQRDYVNGSWTTYGAFGSDREFWTKITCQRPTAPVDVCPNIDGVQVTVPEGTVLDGSGNCVVLDRAPIGYLDSASCSTFNGWTYDEDESSRSNDVHFYMDGPAGSGVWAGAMTADQSRPDVNSAYGITGNHGFSFPTPNIFKDGGTHTVYAYGINTNPANPNNNNSVLTNILTISGCTLGNQNPPNPPTSNPNPNPTIISNISLSGVPATLTAPGSVAIGSTVTTTGVLTNHGIEISFNGATWTNAGAWNDPVSNQERVSDASFSDLNLLVAGTYSFRTYASIDSVNYTYSSIATVVVTGVSGPGTATISNVSISGVPSTLTAPNSITISSTATSNAVLTQHGIEMSFNGGTWTNVGAWNDPVSNQARTTDASFTALNLTTAGTYSFRTYASIDSVNYTYSSGSTVVVTGVSGPGTATISSFTVSPTAITSGSTALLSWATSNATLCIASGDWSGSQAMSGTFNTGVQTVSSVTTRTYTLNCGNSTGTTTQSVTLTVNPAGGGGTGGTISLFNVSPNPVVSGNGATLSWGSTNATLCVASGSWAGNQTTAGTFAIAPITVSVPTNLTYTIACGNSFSTSTQSVTLVVNPTIVVPTVGFSVSPVSGLVTTESGTGATFNVALNSAPTANVVLPIVSSDLTEGSVSIASLTFTPANWNLGQTVTVTGVDDGIVDGNISYMITVGVSASTDVAWNNLAAQTVSVSNTDNDATISNGGGSSGGGGRGGGGGSGGPCIGFGCTTTTTGGSTTGVTPVPDILITFGNSNTGTTVFGPERVCSAANLLTTFLRKGIDNNPNEVRKLQYFLNTYEGANLAVDGDFNAQTEAAVMAFQVKHSAEILAPWGVTTPTGIVYITTARYINTVFCGDNPTYIGNESLKDIIDNSVLYPNVDNSGQFDGAIGQATSSTSSISNIAGVSGAITQRIIDLIKDIPWYQILILLLILIGSGLIMAPTLKRNVATEDFYMSLIRGASALAVGTVLNVLNTLSFILNPQWFTDKAGFGLEWLLALVAINLFALIAICLSVLISLYDKVVKASELTK